MPRSVTLTIAAAAALAGGFAAGRLTASSGSPQQTQMPAPNVAPVDGAAAPWVQRPSRGPADASVVLVEYTDYQCPFCRQYHDDTYRKVLDEYGDRIRYVVRHFPLENIHPFAKGAARAAVCAQRQGRFWDYHDALFGTGIGGLTKEALIGHAVELGLDVDTFRACLESETSADVVAGDFIDGVSHGVRSTPSFIINGRMINSSQPIDTFRAVLDSIFAAGGGS